MAVASHYLEAMAGFQNNYILSCHEGIQVQHSVQVLGICYAVDSYRRMQTGIWLGKYTDPPPPPPPFYGEAC